MRYVESQKGIHWACVTLSVLMLYQGYQWSKGLQEKVLAQEAVNVSLDSTNNQLSQLSVLAKSVYAKTLVSSDVKDIYYLQGLLSNYGLKASEDVRVSKAERYTDRNKVDLGLTSICLRSANNPMISFQSDALELKSQVKGLLENVAINTKTISLDGAWNTDKPVFKSPEICFLVRD